MLMLLMHHADSGLVRLREAARSQLAPTTRPVDPKHMLYVSVPIGTSSSGMPYPYMHFSTKIILDRAQEHLVSLPLDLLSCTQLTSNPSVHSLGPLHEPASRLFRVMLKIKAYI